jgi:hypothetical protein
MVFVLVDLALKFNNLRCDLLLNSMETIHLLRLSLESVDILFIRDLGIFDSSQLVPDFNSHLPCMFPFSFCFFNQLLNPVKF